MKKGKRKRLPLLIAVIAAAVMAALVFAWVSRDRTRLTAALDPIAPDAARDFMSVGLSYDEGTRTFRGTQTLHATNRTGEALDEAVLRTMMNGAAEDSVSITNVTVNGESVRAETDEEEPTVVRIPVSWEPGETVELAWTVMIKHAKESTASMVTLPQLAVWENGAWRTDAYDALCDGSYAQAFDYTMSISAADASSFVFGGALTSARREMGAGETMYRAQMQGARDVTFAVGQSQSVHCREMDGVIVSAVATSAGRAEKLLDAAQKAMQSLDAIGIRYPFATLSLVESDTAPQDGIGYSGVAALSIGSGSEALIQRVTRIVARQTFGVLVESDPYNTPWLSVSLASAAELMAYAQRKGQRALESRFNETILIADRITRPYGVTVGASLAHFGGDAEMTQVLRDQGGAMMMGIVQAVGQDRFVEALVQYAAQNAGGIAVQADLERALYETTGSAWDGYLTDELLY